MRKLITRSVLAAVAVLVMASSAHADLIPIGQLAWVDQGDPDGVYFSVVNQTGAAAALDATDEFPVTTLLTFTVLDLAVTTGGGPVNLTLADFVANLNSLDAAGIPGATSASLTGMVNPGLVTLVSGSNPAWNGSWNILTGILVNSAGVAVITVDPTSFFFGEELIYVEASAVPEPLTIGLFGVGLAGVLARRRKAARR